MYIRIVTFGSFVHLEIAVPDIYKHLNYKEFLQAFYLTTLSERSERGDKIQIFKIFQIFGINQIEMSSKF